MFKFSQKYNKRIVAILLTLFCLNSPLSQADTARRQNVIERTQGYSEGIDLIQIRQDTIRSFKADAGKNKVFNVDNVKVVSDGCGGYTQSSCGTPCCGQEECKNICSTNLSVGSHGSKYTCLETEQTSPCGMSCCGKLDCDNVCLNYRFDPCGGKNFTSKGYKCCGETDCANAECDYFTVTDSSEGGKAGIPCCGWWDCHNKACDNQVFVNSKVDSETGIPCCGAEDCHKVECGGKTKVDSLVYPDRTNLDCCGEENCHLIACDNYIETNTPTGIQACCGYDDCNYKRCEGKFSTTLPNGTVQACCGIKNCEEIVASTLSKQCIYAGSGMFGDGGKVYGSQFPYQDYIKKVSIENVGVGNAVANIYVNGSVVFGPIYSPYDAPIAFLNPIGYYPFSPSSTYEIRGTLYAEGMGLSAIFANVCAYYQ